MPYSFVQQAFDDNGASGTTITSTVFGASLTAGNLLVAHVLYNNATQTTVTLSGASDPTWTEEATVVEFSSHWLHSLYALNIPGGTTTGLTVTFGAAVTLRGVYVAEYSGFKTSGARLAFAAQAQGSPTTGTDLVTSGLLGTLSEQPAGIVGMTWCNGSTTPAAGTGFAALATCWGFGSTDLGRPEHRRVTSTDSVAATFTAGGDSPHLTAGFAFSEGGGAPANQYPHALAQRNRRHTGRFM